MLVNSANPHLIAVYSREDAVQGFNFCVLAVCATIRVEPCKSLTDSKLAGEPEVINN